MIKNHLINCFETKKIVLVFFILIHTSVFSQVQIQKKSNNNSLNLKLNTTSLIDNLSFPTIEIAIEKRFAKFYSVQLETGVQLYELSEKVADTSNISTTGYRIRLEGRYYLSRNSSKNVFKISTFTGVNFLFRKNTYDTNYTYFRENAIDNNVQPPFINYPTINDNIGVDKSVYGANFLFGLQVFINSKFFVEPVIYLGLINRKIENVDRETPEEKDLYGKLLAKGYGDLRESSGVTQNFSIALRIGIKLQ